MKFRSANLFVGVRWLRFIFNIVIALAIVASFVFFPFNHKAQAAGITYYVDCLAGNDNYSGTSTSQAWKTLSKVNRAALAPGDQLLFKRGCTWTGPLEASWRGTQASPILIGAYGTGDLPKFQNGYTVNVRITGTYLILENLQATYATPPNPDPNCGNQPVGWKLGFNFTNSSSYNTLRNSIANKNAIGIALDDNSHHNVITNNTITDNNVVWEHNSNGQLGAMGISLHGSDNEIAYNFFQNNKAICSYTSTIESNTIEVYNAKRNLIHHNKAFGDRVFSEMGSSATIKSEDNVYAYNLHVTALSARAGDSTSKGARFIVTRGEGHSFGPVWRTKVYNNTVYYTGEDSAAIACENCGPTIMTIKNNIIVAKQKGIYIGLSGAAQYQPDESNNVYWSPSGTFPSNFLQNLVTDNTLTQANPQFVNPTTDPLTADFHLRSNSPAIDRGTTGSGYATDLDRVAVPQGAGIDRGAYEYLTTNVSSTYVSDPFTRNVTDSWGSAGTGGSYTLSGTAANYDVDGSAGTVMIPGSSQGRTAMLNGVSTQDMEVTFRVKTDKLAAGNNQFVYFILRRVSSNTEYRGQIRFSTSQAVNLRAVRLVGGAWTNLGTEVRVLNLAHTANSFIWVKAQAMGVNPTTIRIKAWADGQAEPASWHFSVTDSTTSLQSAGSVGLRSDLPASISNAPVTFTFDDFVVSPPAQLDETVDMTSVVPVDEAVEPPSVVEFGPYNSFIPLVTTGDRSTVVDSAAP